VPTVHTEDGFRFFFSPVSLADASGMKAQELARSRAIVEENRAKFEERWDEYFGS